MTKHAGMAWDGFPAIWGNEIAHSSRTEWSVSFRTERFGAAHNIYSMIYFLLR